MTTRAEPTVERMTPAGATETFEWPTIEHAFRTPEREFWLTTVSAEGRPHVVPVFAAWADSSFFVATKSTARKTRDLVEPGLCVVATFTGETHVVVEASAARVHDPAIMARAAAAFADVYSWPTTVVGDQIDAPYAAPTSGGPPMEVWELTPTKAFGFPTDGEIAAPTRWRFDP